MRISICTTVLAFLAGVAGSFVGNRFFVAESVFAQTVPPRALRVNRLELVDHTGKVTVQLDGEGPQLELKSQSQGQDHSVLINSTTITMKFGEHDATLAPGVGLLLTSGKKSISLGVFSQPELIVSSASGIAGFSSIGINIEDTNRKRIWSTPMNIR